MEKIIIIGCPGSGKSTFARELAEILHIPLYHLDILNWNKDGTCVKEELFLERLKNILKKDKWIIDGNYAGSLNQRLAACDSVIFLDYKKEVCLAGIKNRIGKKRPDMPWVEKELDKELLNFVENYNIKNRPALMNLLSQNKDKNIVIFQTRLEARGYLDKIRKENSC